MPPPGLLYGTLCVLNSAREIACHAARIRAAQVSLRDLEYQPPRNSIRLTKKTPEEIATERLQEDGEAERAVKRPRRRVFLANAERHAPAAPEIDHIPEPSTLVAAPQTLLLPQTSSPEVKISSSLDQDKGEACPARSETSLPLAPVEDGQLREVAISSPRNQIEPEPSLTDAQPILPILPTASDTLLTKTIEASNNIDLPPSQENTPLRTLTASKVPSSRIARLLHYGGLAASLSYGAASELVRRSTSSSEDASGGSVMLTEANVSRLVDKLTRMRGAALKLGQFLSIQDTHVLPPQVEDIFRRVQNAAHYMPDWQLEKVISTSLGSEWSSHFASFDRIPFAAASIGQVHNAVLAASSSPTGKEEAVAVKVQFPNVRNSISSDLGYIRLLLTAGRLLPKGLYLDRTLDVMQGELADECDYTREASFIRRFASPGPTGLGTDPRFKVPWVWDGSTTTVLVMERVSGRSLGSPEVLGLGQEERDEIATRVVELCLRELFEMCAMQTDPNFSNFLWNVRTRQVELLDFGASRAYRRKFIDAWLRLLQAAESDDTVACVAASRELGYLTGEEDEIMVNAHVRSMQLLGTPFRPNTQQPYSFNGPEWKAIVGEIRSLIPTMLQRRLTPPPQETYSLNRKLSGAFLLAGRLGARVDCRKVWEDVVGGYEFGRQDMIFEDHLKKMV